MERILARQEVTSWLDGQVRERRVVGRCRQGRNTGGSQADGSENRSFRALAHGQLHSRCLPRLVLRSRSTGAREMRDYPRMRMAPARPAACGPPGPRRALSVAKLTGVVSFPRAWAVMRRRLPDLMAAHVGRLACEALVHVRQHTAGIHRRSTGFQPQVEVRGPGGLPLLGF